MSEQEAYEAGLRQAREECQARVGRIFEAIEKEMPSEHHKYEDFKHEPEHCLLCWWQALKRNYLEQKEGVE